MVLYKKKSQSRRVWKRGLYFLLGGIGALLSHRLLKKDFISIVHNYDRAQSSPDDWFFFYLLDCFLITSAVVCLTIGVSAFLVFFVEKIEILKTGRFKQN